MATSTLIQRLDGTALVTSSTVPGGYDVVTTPDVSNRRQVETFIAGATVVAGDWLQFDTSATGANRVLTVIQAATNGSGNPLVVGVCLGSAESDGSLTLGSKINVVVAGYAEGVNVATAVNAAGIPLAVSATAGRAQATILPAAVGSGGVCGVSLEAAAANKCDVWVYKQF
jgi:6,7-dimethyl-8-ribityllumazine synthase